MSASCAQYRVAVLATSDLVPDVSKSGLSSRRRFPSSAAYDVQPGKLRVTPSVYHGVQKIARLRRGPSPVLESTTVRPVPDDQIDAVLKHVNRYVGAMIQLQRLT